MSVFFAGRARRAAVEAAPKSPAGDGPLTETPRSAATSDTRAYLAALAALVPAEVISLHALIVSPLRTKFEEQQKARDAKIDKALKENNAQMLVDTSPNGALEQRKLFDSADATTLQAVFVGGIVLTFVLYMIGRGAAGLKSPRDWGIAAISMIAFVLWTMLQPATAFDAVFPEFYGMLRTAVALMVAIALLAISTRLQKP